MFYNNIQIYVYSLDQNKHCWLPWRLNLILSTFEACLVAPLVTQSVSLLLVCLAVSKFLVSKCGRTRHRRELRFASFFRYLRSPEVLYFRF